MTAFRFRIKFEDAPRPFWRDVEIGVDRTLAEFGETVNEAMELDDDHLWFFGTERDYWESPVKYQTPTEFDSLSSGGAMWWDEDVFDAGDTPIRSLGLGQWDQICYLYDYVNEWRFYAIVKSILDDPPDDREPAVVDRTEESLSDIVDVDT